MRMNWKKIVLGLLGSVLGLCLLLTGGLYLFKDKIIARVVEAANEQLNTKVQVKKIDLTFWKTFPNLSIEFDQIFIQDTYPDATDIDTLFYTDKLRLRMNPIKAIQKEYVIDQIDVYPGTLQIKVNEAGEGNYNIFKEKEDKTESSPVDVDLNKIILDNIRFKYDDKSINQCYATDLLHTELEADFSKSIFTVHAVSDQILREIRVGNMNFIRDRKASMNVNVAVNQNTGSITIPSSKIFVDNLPFLFEGFIRPDSLQFKVDAANISLGDVAKNLNLKEVDQVAKYSGKGNISFHFLVEDDRLTPEAPVLECQFGVKNGQLLEPTQKIKINDIQVKGEFSNRGGEKKEHLTIQQFDFKTISGPFSGKLKVTEFNAPRYVGTLNGVLALGMIQSLYPIAYVDRMTGTMDIHSQFDLKTNLSDNGKWNIHPNLLMVQSVLNNASIKLAQDERLYEQINGAIDLNSSRAHVRDLTVKVKQSDITVNGTASNFIDFINDKGNIDIAMDLRSKRLNFMDFYTETAVAQQTGTPQPVSNQPRQYIFPHNMIGNIQLHVGTVDFRGHHFESVGGNVRLNNRIMDFTNIQFRTSGSTISGSLRMEERTPELFYSSMQFAGNGIDMQRILKDWNNFDQDVIRSEHLSGTAHVQLKLTAPFDMRTGINYKNIQSSIYLKVVDGRLKNVEALKEVSKSMKTPAAHLAIGKKNVEAIGNRLNDIQFKTFENTIEISNGIVRLPNMTIENSVMNIQLNATHDFDNNIDYRFGFRFRDLKTDRDSEFGNVIDDGTGLLVFLKMYGNLSNPKFAWDKEAKKLNTKEYNKQEKENLKSMLKSDLGLFKKDSTVKKMETKTAPRETVTLDDGQDDTPAKKKEKGKVGKFFEKLKNEEEQKKVTYE